MKKEIVDKGVRFQNYVIDLTIVTCLYNLLHYLFNSSLSWEVFGFEIVNFFYYFIFEFKSGQTIGKKITGTKVVNLVGSPPATKDLLLRSICRISRFDAFSFLFGNNTGIHDIYANTRVVRAF